MRKKIVSGFLALALVFTNVPTDVYARGTGGITTDRENNKIISNSSLADLFNDNSSNNDTSSSGNTTSSTGSSLSDLFNDNSSNNDTSSSGNTTSSTGSSLSDLFNDNSSNNDVPTDSNASGSSSSGALSDLFNDNNSNQDTSTNSNASGSTSSSGALSDLFNDNSSNQDTSTENNFDSATDDTLSDDFVDDSASSDDTTSDNNSTTNQQTSNQTEASTFSSESLASLFSNTELNQGSADNDKEIMLSDSNSGIATLDETINSSTSNISSGSDYEGLVLRIDTSMLGSSVGISSGIDLSPGVTAKVVDTTISAKTSSFSISSFFQKFNIFNPMSINYVSTNKIVDAINTNLISATIGYFGTDFNDFSELSSEEIGNLDIYIPKSADGKYWYKAEEIGMSNFVSGTLPVFDNSDFTGLSSSVVQTGWTFEGGNAKLYSVAANGASIITDVTDIPISGLSAANYIEIDPGTIVTATFSTGDSVNADVTIDLSNTSSTVDLTNVVVTLTSKVTNVYSATIYNISNSNKIVTFNDVPTGYDYTVTITGDYIETYTTDITYLDSDKTVMITIEADSYEVSYYVLNSAGTGLTLSYDYFKADSVASISGLSDDLITFLKLNNLVFDSWTIYKKDGFNYSTLSGTVASVDGISLSNINGISFKMPSYDVIVIANTREYIDGYTVYFYDSSIGSYIDIQTDLTLGNTLNYVEPSSRLGYTFTGWYTSSTLITKWDFDTPLAASHFNSNEIKTLYAGWEGDDINVVINYNNSSSNSGQLSTMKVGQTRTISAGTRPGSSFNYWSWTNNTVYENSYAMSSYVTPNVETSTISFEVPPLEEGSTLTITANWDPLYAYVYVDGIVNGNAAGNSVRVSIYNADYGTIYGEFVGFTTEGDEYYVFNLQDYGTGMFTVDVVSKTSDQEMTSILFVENDEYNHVYVELLPEGKTASVSNSSSVDNVGSNNLKDQFTSADLNSGNDVTIEMVVADVPTNSADANYILQSIGSNQTIGLFIDISLLKDDGTNRSSIQPVASKGLNVTVELPDSFKNQKSYFVSTVHDNIYSQLSSSSVSYDSDTNSISFYTKNLSVFGIGYSGTSSSSAYTGYNIPTADGYYVPLFQNVIVGQWIQGLGKYQLVHPDSANWKFAGWYYGSTGLPLSQYELDNYFVVTQNMITYGIYPRFVQVDEYGNPLTTPVPSTGAFDTIITHELIALI